MALGHELKALDTMSNSGDIDEMNDSGSRELQSLYANNG